MRSRQEKENLVAQWKVERDESLNPSSALETAHEDVEGDIYPHRLMSRIMTTTAEMQKLRRALVA